MAKSSSKIVSFNFFLLIILVLAVFFYLQQIIILPSLSFSLREVEKENNNLKAENLELKKIVFENSSVSHLKKKAEELGLVQVVGQDYLKTLRAVTVMK